MTDNRYSYLLRFYRWYKQNHPNINIYRDGGTDFRNTCHKYNIDPDEILDNIITLEIDANH